MYDGVPAFPVSFFDGQREMDIGQVTIHPAMDYKSFQLMLSQNIGVSPNQISIYLVNRQNNRNSPFSDDRRRIPVTAKANFGAICRQKDYCSFLVILKRSRKSRIRKGRMIAAGDFIYESLPPPPHLILLRRTQPASFYHRSEADMFDAPWWAIKANGEEIKSFCEDCSNAEKNGGTTSFHPCINDAEGRSDPVGAAHGNIVMISELTVLPLGVGVGVGVGGTVNR